LVDLREPVILRFGNPARIVKSNRRVPDRE